MEEPVLCRRFTYIKIIPWIILWIFFMPVADCRMGLEMRIAEDLFAGYDPGIRPIDVIRESINVTIKYKLYQIVELDDTSETLTTINWMSMYWRDPLLSWNASDYGGIDKIYVPSTRVWRPDITIYNGLNEGLQDLRLFDSFNAMLLNTGMVYWSFPAILSTSCTLQLSEFPWDTQVCNITMGSWLFDTSYLRIKAETDEVVMTQFRRNALWDVIRAPISMVTKQYPCCTAPFEEITLYYVLRRNGLYYCFNILFPSALLLATTLLSFLIPIESGEKISIPVTMFLSQSFLLFAVTQFLPVQSDVIPAIGYILLGIMMLIGLCIICNILVSYTYFKYSGPPPSIRLLTCLRLLQQQDYTPTSEEKLLNGRQQEETNFDETFISKSSPKKMTYSLRRSPLTTETDGLSGGGGGGARRGSGRKKMCARARDQRTGSLFSICSGKCREHCTSVRESHEIDSDKWKDVAQRLNILLFIGTTIASILFTIGVMLVFIKNKGETEHKFKPWDI